ncbi:MAG: hypothetical protein E6H78_20895 [Betaproteobacteria bacterium]|nr:MAG: hypothetical protein E6H78_20895 [Betaproteobacteria bacterium]
MRRPVGVTASAIVAIIGSLMTLLFAGVMLLTLVMPESQPQPPTPGYTGVAIGVAIVFALLAATGIWTAIGLFRLQSWARTSMIVFAGSLAVFGLLTLILVAMTPTRMPAEAAADLARVRPLLITMFLIPVAIGAWWLFQFNAPSTVQAFRAASPETQEPERPVSISLIAWTTLIGGVVCIIPVFVQFPAIIFGLEVTGWLSRLVYAVYAAVSISIGWGLLRLRERARIAAIAWYGLSLLHTAVVVLVPSLRERMLEASRNVESGQTEPLPWDPTTFVYLTLAFVVALVVATIWFLLRHRGRFHRDGTTGITPQSPPTQ